jgi:hypothetical protein
MLHIKSYILFKVNYLLASFLVCFIISSSSLQAQDSTQTTTSDTIIIDMAKPHSPAKAALMSTVVPGLGQAYNKKYWKIPIVYGAIGTSIYFAVENNKTYQDFKKALTYRLDDNPETIDEYNGRLSTQSLESNMNFYQRNRDLSIIVAGIFYVLNIVDASVDAHLYSFPKNDNLSLMLVPSVQLAANQPVSGASLVFNF